jgi:DNA repair protein RadC
MLELPLQERPRERLMDAGEEALSVAELLAILLGTGTKGKSVIDLSHELLETFGGLPALLEASIEELQEIKGIGSAKALLLKAAFALALRYRKFCTVQKKVSAASAQEAYFLLKDKLGSLKQEAICVLLRDAKGQMIGIVQVALGTLSQVLIHPREVFFPAIRHKAHSIIIAHNHPSGDPTPSTADLEMTKKLFACGEMMGIPVDDHLIIGKGTFTSLKKYVCK